MCFLTFVALASCNSGRIVPDSGGCEGSECDGGSSSDARGDAESDARPIDPCDAIVCGGNQECREGRCMALDLCSEVVCVNSGEVCDPRDGRCYSGGADDDEDGYTIAENDCDDGDDSVHPGAAELCDGADQDCDYEIDEGFPDLDYDGFDTCGFGVQGQEDCNDANPSQNPGQVERCDGLDNNCDGQIDEELDTRDCATTCGSGIESCQGGDWVCSAPEVCECTPVGEREEQECGFCGTRSRTCSSDLRWGLWTECTGQGECAAGTLDTRTCGNCELGTQSRTCDTGCSWRDWDDCPVAGEGGCLSCNVDIGELDDGPYLGDMGWSGRETEWFSTSARWIVQPLMAEVTLGVIPGVDVVAFTWAADDYQEDCSPGDGFRHGTVTIEGSSVGAIAIPTGMDFHTHTFPVPAEASADGILEIVIEADHAYSPSVCGYADTRWLAIYVDSISAC